MNFYRLVHSIEELVFQFSIWLLLFPKTLIKIIRHPSWIQPYVEEEIKKERGEQFQEYLSPILFWVLIGVVPVYYLSFDFFKGFLTALELMEAENFDKLKPETIMAGIAVFLITGPLTFSIFLERKLKEPISYSSIRDTFYIQVYIFGPTQLLAGLGQLKLFEIVVLNMNAPEISDTDTFWLIYFLFGILYYFFWMYQEYLVFRKTLNNGKLKSFLQVLYCTFISYTILIGVMIILATIGVMRMEGV